MGADRVYDVFCKSYTQNCPVDKSLRCRIVLQVMLTELSLLHLVIAPLALSMCVCTCVASPSHSSGFESDIPSCRTCLQFATISVLYICLAF